MDRASKPVANPNDPKLDLDEVREWFDQLTPFGVKAIAVLGPGPYEAIENREVVGIHPSEFVGEAAALAQSDAFGTAWRSTDGALGAWRELPRGYEPHEHWVPAWMDQGALFVVRVDFPTAFNQGFECFVFCEQQADGADTAVRIAYTALGAWPRIQTEIAAKRYNITPLEHQVLVLVAEGLMTKVVGKRIGYGERMVGYAMQSVQNKLNAPNRPAAIQRACMLGLL